MLNLLCGSKLNTHLYAWAQLHGTFDFNCTPIASPGMYVLIHEKPSIRGTWAPHVVEGWYLRPALHSYQCYTVWSKDTHAQCICDTLTWLPSTVTVPTATMVNYILAGITDFTNALQKPPPNSPLEPLTKSQVMALEQLMVVLHGKKKGNHNTVPDVVSTTTAPTLRVGPLSNMQPQHEQPVTALRVDPKPTPQQQPIPSNWQYPANGSQIDLNALILPAIVEGSSMMMTPQ